MAIKAAFEAISLKGGAQMRRIISLGLLLGAGFGTWNLIATILDPLAEDTPIALLAFYGPMFGIWGLAGFSASRRTGRFLDAVRVGASVAFVTFVVFVFARIVVVNLFLDTTSQRPDWPNLIERFQASGFESLRSYVNYVYLTGAPFKILVASIIGAGAGLVGGFIGSLGRRETGRVPQ
jgi:hypothetical protein